MWIAHTTTIYILISTRQSLIDFTEVSLKFYQTHFLSTKWKQAWFFFYWCVAAIIIYSCCCFQDMLQFSLFISLSVAISLTQLPFISPVGMLMVLLFPFLCFSISHSITQKLKWLKKKFKQPLISLSSFLLFEWDLNSVWAIGLISFRFSGCIISFDILTPLSWTNHTLWSILDMGVSLSPFMHLHDWSTNISYSFMLASTNSNLIFIFTLPSHINRAYIKNPKFYLFLVCVLLVK